jgi:carboxylate-amine ligase
MGLIFKESEFLTMGVEIELQIIDPDSLDLTPATPRIFDKLGGVQTHIKPEILQAMIEVSTKVCRTIGDVEEDLNTRLNLLREVGKDVRVTFATAGSHPFARHRERIVYPADRYSDLIDRNRWIARRLMIFGLHIHVGMRNADHAMAMNNAMVYYLPHLLAISASSPFWQGSDTGLASTRTSVFEALPTGGHPEVFRTWQSFESFYDALIKSGSIKTIKDIWWDIRPHPDFGTVELRVCDGVTSMEETMGLVALVQSLYAWFDDRYNDGDAIEPPTRWIVRENKWKSSRYGLNAKIILDPEGNTSLLKDEVLTLIETVRPYAVKNGADRYLNDLKRIVINGPSYIRQRKIYNKTNDFNAVTKLLLEEFESGKAIYG